MSSERRIPGLGVVITAATWAAGLSVLTLLNFLGFHTGQGVHLSDNQLVNVLALGPLWVWYGVVILGALSFMRGGSGALAWAGLVLASIPCCSPWVVLGMPFAIWAITMMRKGPSTPQRE